MITEERLEQLFWEFDALHKNHYRDADPSLPGPLDERGAFKRIVRKAFWVAEGETDFEFEMTRPTFSVVLHHTPWRSERVHAAQSMLLELRPNLHGFPFLLHDTDYRDRDWQSDGKVAWALAGWRWAVTQRTTQHLFLTDDLVLAPGFVQVLGAMVEATPNTPIGLLSNHPKGPEHARVGCRFYDCNSWIVGPGYVLSHEHLEGFLGWFESLPDGVTRGCKGWANDDSSINLWISNHGPRRSRHPLPTIIEHRADLESTVGHGDRYSRERLSWRAERWVEDREDGSFVWKDRAVWTSTEVMKAPAWWAGGADVPMLAVGEG